MKKIILGLIVITGMFIANSVNVSACSPKYKSAEFTDTGSTKYSCSCNDTFRGYGSGSCPIQPSGLDVK
jgi:hypothetical protein